MKTILAFLVWCVLLAICWPLALLALVLLPVVWLIALPFRVAFITLEAGLALVKALLTLPARVIGHK